VRRRLRVARHRRCRHGRGRGVRRRDGGGGVVEVRGVRPHDRRLGRPGVRGQEADRVADGEDDQDGGDPREVRPEPGRHVGSGRRPRRRAWHHGHATREPLYLRLWLFWTLEP
jgi:hypothetical protein